MIVLIQFLQDNFWTVENVGTNPNDYNPKENQKIVEADEWPIQGEWVNSDLLWDDVAKKLIVFPASLKVELYKKQKLAQLADKIINNETIIDKAVITNTVSSIKAAKDQTAVDAALNNIEVAKKDYLKSVGL